MSPEILAKLSRIKNRSTRYEIVLSHPDGRSYLAWYGAASRQSIDRALVGERAAAIARITGETRVAAAGTADQGLRIGPWSLKPSRRTQRDAIIAGELPFILEVQPEDKGESHVDR